MMHLIVIVLCAAFSITGCDSDHDRMIKIMERQIRETIKVDWQRDGIPLDSLVKSNNNCIKYPDVNGCEIVVNQIKDIAISLASCLVDQRSSLCKAVIRDISKHPIADLLPAAEPLKLPDQPMYFDLPTTTLEALSSRFEYRKEVSTWWWQAWGTFIIFCIALLIIFIGAWQWWRQWRSAKQQRAAILARQNIAHIEQEKSRRVRKKQVLADAEYQAKLAHDAAIAEQQHVALENFAKQQAAEATAQLAKEQAEAAMVLASIFKASEKPDRK